MSAQIFADLEREADAHDRRSPAGRVAAVAIVVGGYLGIIALSMMVLVVLATRHRGFAGVYGGSHRPTAVVFGYALGCAALLVTVLAVRRFRTTKEAFR